VSLIKISGNQPLTYAALPVALAPGEVFNLPPGQGVVGNFGGVSSPQIATNNQLTGQYLLGLGLYSALQVLDPILSYWRNVQVTPGQMLTVSADGTNFRVANTTGCPVGAIITNAGSGLTNGFNTVTVTPSAGGSTWNTIVGGAVNTTISVSGTVFQNGAFGGTGTSQVASAGSGYTRPPLIVFAPPSTQGQTPYILPTAIAAISAGAISSITVTNQGAGLVGLPQITVVPQPGDTTGGGAIVGWLSGNSGMVGSGTLLAMWPATYSNTGVALTAVPTFTFSPASTIAATAIMNFTVTGFTQTQAGVSYVAAGGSFNGGIVAGAAANTNPIYDKALSIPQYPPVTVAATTGLPALAGPWGGVNLQAVPTFSAFSTGAAPATAAITTVTVGGANDVNTLMSL
jgi:hypothetical protein